MNDQKEIDSAIIEAIDDAISTIKVEAPGFERKFRRRIMLKLTGHFRESDLLDLIEAVPEEPGT